MHLPENVKNIIFDFGGVIINIDFELSYKAFEEFGVKNLSSIFSQAKQTELFDKFEKGIISPHKFRNLIKTLLNLKISDKVFDIAWNKMILDIPKERIELLQNLQSRYRIFLLSNSNQIHFDLYNSELRRVYQVNFEDLFEKVYFSFNKRMIKPNKDFFQLLIEQNNLNTDETLFIDDSIQHIKTAKDIGLKTFHLKNTDVVSLFQKHNLISASL